MDLSSLLPDPKKDNGGYYEMLLHQHKEMEPSQRDAHIRSMVHSQRQDYGKKLRVVVIPSEFGLREYVGPVDASNFVPGLTTALYSAAEVVIRQRNINPQFEYVLKGERGAGEMRRITGDL